MIRKVAFNKMQLNKEVPLSTPTIHKEEMEYVQKSICLPSDIKVTEDEQDHIIEIIESCF